MEKHYFMSDDGDGDINYNYVHEGNETGRGGGHSSLRPSRSRERMIG